MRISFEHTFYGIGSTFIVCCKWPNFWQKYLAIRSHCWQTTLIIVLHFRLGHQQKLSIVGNKSLFVCFFEAKMQLQPLWPEWAIFVTSRRQILLTKVAQLFGDFLGKFETITFYLKTAVSTFWGNFVKIWGTFYSNIWSHWLQRQQSICQQLL